MQKVVNIWQSLKHPGEKILGHRDTFAMENRHFSLMSFVSMAVLGHMFIGGCRFYGGGGVLLFLPV